MDVNDTITPFLKKVRDEMATLNRLKIKVGIQGDADSEILTIARVHEYGATITAKSTKNLCIPIHADSFHGVQKFKILVQDQDPVISGICHI